MGNNGLFWKWRMSFIEILNFCFQIRCDRKTGQGLSQAKSLCYLQFCMCCIFCFVIQLLSEPDKQDCRPGDFKVWLGQSRESCCNIIILYLFLSFHSYFTIKCTTFGSRSLSILLFTNEITITTTIKAKKKKCAKYNATWKSQIPK